LINLEKKVDSILSLVASLHRKEMEHLSQPVWHISQKTLIATLITGVIGYFLYKFLDYHLGDLIPTKRRQ